MRSLVSAVVVLGFACGEGAVPFRLTGVTPGDAASALGAKVALVGTGLDRLRTAALVSRDRRVELAGVTPVDETHGEAQLAPGVPAGLYDVELVDGAGAKATLAHALRLVDGELRIEVIDVGQGDGSYIQAPGGRTLVIDGGRAHGSADSIVPTLEARGLNHPDLVLVTHFDSDHLGGVVDLLRGPDGVDCTADDRVPALGLFDYAPGESTCNSELCVEYYRLRACNAAHVAGGAGGRVPLPGERIPLGGGVTVTVVAVNGEVAGGPVVATGSDNSNCIGLLVEFGRFRYFTSGDLTGGPEAGCNPGMDSADVETGVGERIGRVDVLHVNHHGSCTSSNAAFLRATSPQAALVSVGENNPYGHPNQATVDRLDGAGARLLLTNPGITTAGPFAKTRLPASAERTFGSLRVRTRDGQAFSVDVLDVHGAPTATRDYTVR